MSATADLVIRAKMDAAAATRGMGDLADSTRRAGDAADAAGQHLDNVAEHADTVASKGAQAAGALSGLGDLVGGKFGSAMMVGGVAMQAFADAGDLVNVVTESAIVRKIKDTAVTVAHTVASKTAAAAQKVWAAAQWALNAAMDANPIGLLVLAIAALVAGVIVAYKKSQTFRDIINGVFRAIKNVAAPIVNWFADRIPKVWNAIKETSQRVWQTIKGAVTNPISTAKATVSRVVGAIKTAVGGAWDWIRNKTSTVFSAVKDRAVAPFNSIVDTIKGVPGRIRDLAQSFKNAGGAVISALIDGLKHAGSFVSDIAGKVWDAVKGMLNAAIDKINSALEFKINPPGPGSITINPPDIPHLATGGIVTSPTIALVGEAGPEVVIPLSRLNGLGTVTINIPVTVNGFVGNNDQLARAVAGSVNGALIRRGLPGVVNL